MKFVKIIINGLVLPLLVVSISLSCTKASLKSAPIVTIKPKKGNGPPPHAPAHGYRAKTRDGIEVVYNSKLGVYEVFGISSYYYSKGFYYRVNDDQWEASTEFHGSWEVVAEYRVPFGLRYGKETKRKGKGQQKG
jgi:hypothetical protein